MELIFESVEERDEFFMMHVCPSKCGGTDFTGFDCMRRKCIECWEQSGVKYRVKEKKQEYDTITVSKRLYRIQSLYKSARRLDPNFREDDYVWIIGEALIDHLADIGYEYRSAGDKYKSLAGICITTCHDYPLRVILAKKNLKNVGPTPDYPITGCKHPSPSNPVPIEEQKGCYTEIVINEPLRPGDKLVKKDGKFYVEKRPEGWWKDNPYLKVDIPKPDITPNEHWMDKKIEDYIREVTIGDIQMFLMTGRQQGKTELHRRIMETLFKDGYFDIGKELDPLKVDSTRTALAKLSYGFYHNKNWKEAIDIFMDKHDRIKKPQIEKVIFNDPATIVFWKDGTKTVVKCQEGDKFDEEKGLAMAICKKVYGEGYWTGVFKKWVPKESVSKRLYAVGKLMSVAMNESMRRATENLKNLEKALDDIATVKRCETCAYKDLGPGDEPCRSCKGRPEPSNWKPKPSEPLRPCEECKHADVHEFHEPCRSCKDNSGFEEKELKVCANCKYSGTTSGWPCMYCGALSRDMFEPRIDK